MDKQEPSPLTKQEVLKLIIQGLKKLRKGLVATSQLAEKDRDWVGKRVMSKIEALDKTLEQVIKNP